MTSWITCTSHAAVFPAGWEAEHAAGPLASGNGPCVLVPDSLVTDYKVCRKNGMRHFASLQQVAAAHVTTAKAVNDSVNASSTEGSTS